MCPKWLHPRGYTRLLTSLLTPVGKQTTVRISRAEQAPAKPDSSASKSRIILAQGGGDKGQSQAAQA